MTARRRNVDWKAAAARLALAFPRARLHPAVVRWAETSSKRRRWAVAFSGGADSLALLLLVWAHWPERRAQLRALHFDHRLRGAASTADARFCRQVCRALGVTFVLGRWTGGRKHASEAEARAARHAFFQQHSRELWLGHQQDDIAETLLMRLARGSGTAGLAAPRPVQVVADRRVHLRPLLTLRKDQLVAALRAADIPWREDASNAGADYFRNRIRLAVLPAWIEAAQRDALLGAARSRALLEEDDAALEAWVDELQPCAGRELDLARLAGKPRAVLRRALHQWLRRQPRAGELSSQAFESLLEAAAAGRPTRQSLGRHGFARVRHGRLRYEKAGTA